MSLSNLSKYISCPERSAMGATGQQALAEYYRTANTMKENERKHNEEAIA